MRPLLLLLLLASPAVAGLHDAGLALRPPPVEWRGFLSDLRTLRLAGTAAPGPNPLRDTLSDRAAALETQAKTKPLTADESADLGAIYVRLGQPLKAVAVLRPVRTAHPKHFRAAANLGAAWHLAGDFAQAALALDEAVELAPAEWKEVETFHRKLVGLRAKEKAGSDALDDLFGLIFVGESGKPEAGKIAADHKKKLPENAVAIVQHLLTISPADARLLWLLAEVANATGDPATAANILDGCVGDFGLKSDDARARRKVYRAAADALAKTEDHKTHKGTTVFKSQRLLAKLTDETRLPKIDPTGVNRLPWAALGDTAFGKKFPPKYLKFVDDLDGKTVEMVGFMRPFGDGDITEFTLLEFPVGCWFCDLPGPLQVMAVETKPGAKLAFTPGAVVVVGKLELNRTDPEKYLFVVTGATVKRPE